MGVFGGVFGVVAVSAVRAVVPGAATVPVSALASGAVEAVAPRAAAMLVAAVASGALAVGVVAAEAAAIRSARSFGGVDPSCMVTLLFLVTLLFFCGVVGVVDPETSKQVEKIRMSWAKPLKTLREVARNQT